MESSSPIDLVITYVNSADRTWRRSYAQTTHTYHPAAARYRSWGLLKYLFRGIAEYMPFIRNVVFVVSGPTQVPVWINRDTVRVVYHEDFIPKEFLPTFNSCTIESFFWNIPDLADRVIYINDDMFPMGPMTEEDFFTGDTPHISFHNLNTLNPKNMFRVQCRNGYNLVAAALDKPQLEQGKVLRPMHISSAFNRESMSAIAELCKDTLPATISTLRQSKNVNQYIYLYYHYLTDTRVESTLEHHYFDLMDDNLEDILMGINEGQYKFICLNDYDNIKDFSRFRIKLQYAFGDKFPTACIYEV